MGVPVDTFKRSYWAFIGADDWEAISGENEDFKFTSGSTMELQVEGDTYTLRVNGRAIQTITIAGYSSGGISLGLACTYNCPSFDNVKVIYLP